MATIWPKRAATTARDDSRKAEPAVREMEVVPDVVARQKLIPVESVGCRVPGGRYAHVASALRTVTAAPMAEICARISRLEGMEAHARSADLRADLRVPGRSG